MRSESGRRCTAAVSIAALLVLLVAQPLHAQQPAACTPSNLPVKLLAVGDSLTNGAVPSLNRNNPYSAKLGQLMQAELGSSRPVEVKTVGRSSGWRFDCLTMLCPQAVMSTSPTASPPHHNSTTTHTPPPGVNSAGTIMTGLDTSGKETTLLQLLERELSARQRFDVIVLMGGINDLGRGNKTAVSVFNNLQGMADKAARAATAAVVVVAPWANRFVARTSDNEAQRLKLNAMLKGYFAGGKDAAPRMLLDEIEAREFSFWTLPSEEVRRLQDDMLHLTADGYNLLGGQLFAFLQQNGVMSDLKCG